MRTLGQRFLDKIGPRANDRCWHWLGAKGSNGYGQMWVIDHKEQAHRISYWLFVGPIPAGATVDHICKVKDCVNPKHLRTMTMLENVMDGCKNLKKTHCPKGHPYGGKNLIRYKTFRYCRTCKNVRDREDWLKKKEKRNAQRREAWRRAKGEDDVKAGK